MFSRTLGRFARSRPLARFERCFSAKTFVKDNWPAVTYTVCGLTFLGGVAVYKLNTDPLNYHPAVDHVVNTITQSGITGENTDLTRSFMVTGKIYHGTAARLYFNVYTDKGKGKVMMISNKHSKSDLLRQEPWRLKGDEQGDEVWLPKSITVDFVGKRERWVYDASSDRFDEINMPMNAVALTDFAYVGATEIYGPMYDKAASMSRLQYLLIAGAIGVPFMLWRGYVKNVLLPQPFRQVSKKLTTNEVVSKLLGDEVKVSRKYKGTIGKNTATFKFDATGSKHTGTVSVQALNENGTWNILSAKMDLFSKKHDLKMKGSV